MRVVPDARRSNGCCRQILPNLNPPSESEPTEHGHRNCHVWRFAACAFRYKHRVRDSTTGITSGGSLGQAGAANGIDALFRPSLFRRLQLGVRRPDGQLT